MLLWLGDILTKRLYNCDTSDAIMWLLFFFCLSDHKIEFEFEFEFRRLCQSGIWFSAMK